MLKEVLITTRHQMILSFLASHPDQPFYGREISKKIRVSLGAANKALKELHRSGLLIKEKRGKTVLYFLNDRNLFLRQFRVLNTVLRLETVVMKLKGISRKVILYGSCAKGTDTRYSDLDLFIVSNNADRAMKILGPYFNPSDVWPYRLRPVIRSTSEWSNLEENDPTYFNQLSKGIILWEQIAHESRV